MDVRFDCRSTNPGSPAGELIRDDRDLRQTHPHRETIQNVPGRSSRLIRRFHSLPPFCMAQAKESAAAPSAVKPAKVFRRRGITVSVFANPTEIDGRTVSFHKVTVQRTYRDGNEFKTTTAFGRDDLPIVSLLVGQAWEFILDAESGRGSDEAA